MRGGKGISEMACQSPRGSRTKKLLGKLPIHEPKEKRGKIDKEKDILGKVNRYSLPSNKTSTIPLNRNTHRTIKKNICNSPILVTANTLTLQKKKNKKHHNLKANGQWRNTWEWDLLFCIHIIHVYRQIWQVYAYNTSY